ncbi:MAG: DNA polymerase IV, partial [Planctomycetota bacterium]
MILHADMDAFFASVEQRRDPRLRDRPVVVGGRPGEASVIASCSYEARRHGLHAGMPLRRAQRLCPRAVFLTGSYPEYRRVSDIFFSLLRDLSPVVEVVSLDEAYVDLSGAEHLHGGAWRAARALRRRAWERTGLAVSVGLGSSRVLARLATARAKPDGIGFLWPARAHAFLQALPLRALPGIGRKTLQLFERLNLRRAGDLAG